MSKFARKKKGVQPKNKADEVFFNDAPHDTDRKEDDEERCKIIGFSLRASDVELLERLRHRLASKGAIVTKSEALRTLLELSTSIPDEKLLNCYRSMPQIKTGPKKRS